MFPKREKISRVSCGFDSTACLSISGKIYTFGNNLHQNLGLTKKTVDTYLNTRGGVEGKGGTIIKEPQLVEGLADKIVIQVKS